MKQFQCFDCPATFTSRFLAICHAIYATVSQKLDVHRFGEDRRSGEDRRTSPRYQVSEQEGKKLREEGWTQ